LLSAVTLPVGLNSWDIRSKVAATALFAKQRRLHEQFGQRQTLPELMQHYKTRHLRHRHLKTNILWLLPDPLPKRIVFTGLTLATNLP
jgi:hypothetical protein